MNLRKIAEAVLAEDAASTSPDDRALSRPTPAPFNLQKFVDYLEGKDD